MNIGDLVTYRNTSKRKMFGLVMAYEIRFVPRSMRWVNVFWNENLIVPPWEEKIRPSDKDKNIIDEKSMCKWHREAELEVLYGN